MDSEIFQGISKAISCENVSNVYLSFPYPHSQGRPCQLIVHLDRGFCLLDSALGSTGGSKQPLWSFSFDRLKGSADDGNKLLYLDFSGSEDGGEIVSFAITLPFFLFDGIPRNVMSAYSTGTGHGVLPEAGGVCPAQLSVGQGALAGVRSSPALFFGSRSKRKVLCILERKNHF